MSGGTYEPATNIGRRGQTCRSRYLAVEPASGMNRRVPARRSNLRCLPATSCISAAIAQSDEMLYANPETIGGPAVAFSAARETTSGLLFLGSVVLGNPE